MSTLLYLSLVLAALSLAQLVAVPLVASARGHSGALWFMVTALWLATFAYGAAAFGFGAWFFSATAWRVDGFAKGYAAVSAGAALLAWLPLVAVALTQRRPTDRRRGTFAGRRGAFRRGRNFSTSARE